MLTIGLAVTSHHDSRTADAFTYYQRPWTGNGTVTVHVVSIEGTNPWAKTGVMFRDSLSPGVPQVMAIVSPGKGLAMQYRTAAGGVSANAALHAGTATFDSLAVTP